MARTHRRLRGPHAAFGWPSAHSAPPHRVLQQRAPLYHPNVPYVVFWSEKAGCTGVVKWFLAQAGLLDEALAYDPWVHNFRIKHFPRRRPYLDRVRAALATGDHQAIKVVRHPLRRAVSGFLVIAEGSAVQDGEHWVKEYWREIVSSRAAAGRDPHAGFTFLEHLEHVARQLRAGRFVDSHLLPQHVTGEEALGLAVLPIERFREWTRREEEAGRARPVEWDALFGSGHHHSADPARTAALGPTPEAMRITPAAFADGRFADVSVFINPRTMPLLEAIYGADLTAYGSHYRAVL